MFTEKLTENDIIVFIKNKLKFQDVLNVEFKEDRILVCAIKEKNKYPKTIKNFVLKDFKLKLVIPYKFASRVKDGEIYNEKWLEFMSINFGKTYLEELNKQTKQNEKTI